MDTEIQILHGSDKNLQVSECNPDAADSELPVHLVSKRTNKALPDGPGDHCAPLQSVCHFPPLGAPSHPGPSD